MVEHKPELLRLVLRVAFGGPIAWCAFIVAFMMIADVRPGNVNAEIGVALWLFKFSAVWAVASIGLLAMFLPRFNLDPSPKLLVAPNVILLIGFLYMYASGLAGA